MTAACRKLGYGLCKVSRGPLPVSRFGSNAALRTGGITPSDMLQCRSSTRQISTTSSTP